MKCLYLEGAKQLVFKEVDVSKKISEDDVLVKIEARGICGTDLNSYRTGYPNGFGHEIGGYIEKAGKNTGLTEGKRVFVSNLCAMNFVPYEQGSTFPYLGGFGEWLVIKNARENEAIYTCPDDMPFSKIALIEPFCVAMSGVKKSAFNTHSKIVILGAGIIGMGAFLYLKTQGVKNVVMVDINEHRLALAEKAGAMVFNSKSGSLNEFLTTSFGTAISQAAGMTSDVDCYIDCAGVSGLLAECLNNAKYGAKFIILAAYHDLTHLNMASVMYNSVAILGSCMFGHEDIVEARALIYEHDYIFDTLVSHEIKFEEAVEGFKIADDASQSLKVILVG